MGSCMSSDKQKSSAQYFKKDTNLIQKTEIYQPLTTTLFNIMRKYNDVIVIFADPNKAKDFSGIALDDVKAMPAKSLKMMYSFKRLVIVGSFTKVQKDVLEIVKMATVTAVYVVESKVFERFQKDFALFESLRQLSSVPTSKIPLLVFSSQQLIRPPQKPYQIFIHSVDQRDTQVYSKLKIQGVIQPSSNQNSDDQIRYYIDKLKSNASSRVVLLHTKSLGQSALMQILSEYLTYLYEASDISVKGYLARTLPNVVIVPTTTSSKMLQQATNLKKQTVTNVDEFHRLFKQHLNEGNQQKTQRAYNLLGKLVANIITNPQAENYRKVKGINKQMEELLTRSGAGVKLLKFVGFNQNGGFWVNELQGKYLKVLRADMDLGYRKAVNQNGGQE